MGYYELEKVYNEKLKNDEQIKKLNLLPYRKELVSNLFEKELRNTYLGFIANRYDQEIIKKGIELFYDDFLLKVIKTNKDYNTINNLINIIKTSKININEIPNIIRTSFYIAKNSKDLFSDILLKKYDIERIISDLNKIINYHQSYSKTDKSSNNKNNGNKYGDYDMHVSLKEAIKGVE